MADVLHTAVCDLFGVRYPIVQTGMGWVSTPGLTAATCEAGGLGILASATLTMAETDAAIARVRELTTAPFGVNLRGDAPDLADRARLLVKHGVRVASFARAPSAAVIESLKEAGLLVVPTIGALRHAEKVAALGADAVIAQGAEAGGHTGQVPTSILLPQVSAAVDIPVIGAGGFYDGRGLVAALASGAAGIAMGTRFLLTAESPVPDAVKQEYLKRGVTDTIVTTALDGVPQRVLRTPLAESLDRASRPSKLYRSVKSARAWRRGAWTGAWTGAGTGAGTGARTGAGTGTGAGTSWRDMIREGLAMRRAHELTWSQVLMAANTPMMLRASMVDGRIDLGTLASGQVAGVIDDVPTCADLIARIMTEARDVLAHLTQTPVHHA